MQNRRDFLKAALAASAATTLFARAGAGWADLPPAARPMRLLILGGTGFTGPHQVAYALARGHQVTVFNRGRTNPGILPDEVEQLIGDRNGDLDALRGREWDVVIDVPATLPRWVRGTTEILRDAAERYVFVSSISVYADHSTPGADETAAVQVLANLESEDVRADYGALKAASEQVVRDAFGNDRALIVRPGLIVGPGDPTDRYTYWPVRVNRGGEVLAPGTPADPVQIIDARDLAEWIIRMAEQRAAGDFNATGPASPMSIGDMLHGARDATGSDATFTWVDAGFLAAQEVAPWSQMPVWLPPTGDYAGFASRDISKALAHGLSFRPYADTVRATLAWFSTLPAERQAALRAGITAEREAAVLAAWRDNIAGRR